MSALTVRLLGPADAVALFALRREALEAEPFAFGASPADDRFRDVAAVERTLADRDGRAVAGGFDGAALAAMAGLVREQGVKARHKAFIWGMYVRPAARGRGAAGLLLEALVAEARRWTPPVLKVDLSVTSHAASARALYERAGFRAWGSEPRALCWEGRCVDETFMSLDLDGGGGAP